MALIILLVGFAVFYPGLKGSFEGDDFPQIVNNVPVHSISHIKIFFEGSTFYNGDGLAPLSGAYYRPLMTTTFSLIYTLFGAQVLYFHLFQLLVCMGSAFLLYLFFRYSFNIGLSLFLALVFLVHPLNSQVVFAIPSMQDALFFFFGILALWLLVRFRSVKSLGLVALSLFLCLLSKETAVVFIVMALLYLFWWDRKRLIPFIGIMVLPVALWLTLKINALGLLGTNPNNAPIDRLNLAERLMTAPSILFSYITKFVFPWKLASAYYWTYPHFSIRHVLLPLIIDLLVIVIAVYGALVIRRRSTKAQYYTYLFFAAWAVLGLLTTLQVIPVDMTACETWFYFPMAGVLGMIGVAFTALRLRINPYWIAAIALVLLVALGIRTGLRGHDWRNQYTLAYKDVSASKDNYIAYNIIAAGLNSRGNFKQGKLNAQRSIAIFPTFSNYNNLGVSDEGLHTFAAAQAAFKQGLRYGDYNLLYDNLAELTLLYGSIHDNEQFLLNELEMHPHDSTLWMYLAIQEYKDNDNSKAKIAISNAATYGHVPPFIYSAVVNNQPLTIEITNLGLKVTVQ